MKDVYKVFFSRKMLPFTLVFYVIALERRFLVEFQGFTLWEMSYTPTFDQSTGNYEKDLHVFINLSNLFALSFVGAKIREQLFIAGK